jgi:hypothetical protein
MRRMLRGSSAVKFKNKKKIIIKKRLKTTFFFEKLKKKLDISNAILSETILKNKKDTKFFSKSST